jgi:hypothetical protein
MKVEQTRQQIGEILAIRQALISRGELEEEDAYYEKMKPLLAQLQARLVEVIKANWARLDINLGNAKMKAIKEMMEKKDAESKADQKKRKADFEKMMANMKAKREERKAGMMACLRKMEARIETGQEQSNTEIETHLEAVAATENGGCSGVAGDA